MTQPSRVRELTSAQLARYAHLVFVFEGRHINGARLIYHALATTPTCGDAMAALSDFLDQEGTESLSACVMEWGLRPWSEVDADARRALEDRRFRSQWWWGFARHDSGLTTLEAKDFENRSHFILDQPRYDTFVAEMVERAGSLEAAFLTGHTLVGALGGLLEHRQLGRKAPMSELSHPDRFTRTAAYDAWLESPTAPYEELERKRAEASAAKEPPRV